MKSKIAILLLILCLNVSAEDKMCALMIEDEIDTEEFSEVTGKKIYFCCGSCVKKFDANAAYYIKAIPSLAKKFTDAEKKKLGVDKVTLLEQKYCPIYPDRLINPTCKTVDYKGKKVYFWSSSAVRKWQKEPEKYYAAAKKRGHLAQFK
ncbi:MAG: hypothetical protein MK132_15295 [Lentisphaerales bacterium]|nr:hypothetical protein [Lentisphaerales bacterium]